MKLSGTRFVTSPGGSALGLPAGEYWAVPDAELRRAQAQLSLATAEIAALKEENLSAHSRRLECDSRALVAEHEVAAWRALAAESSGRAASLDFSHNDTDSYEAELVEYPSYGHVVASDAVYHSESFQAAAIALAEKLGLSRDAGERGFEWRFATEAAREVATGELRAEIATLKATLEFVQTHHHLPEPIGDTCAECGEGSPVPGRSWCAVCIGKPRSDE